MTDLSLNIRTADDGEKVIEILYSGYNIIQEIIYDDKLASKIFNLVNNNRQSNPNDKPL